MALFKIVVWAIIFLTKLQDSSFLNTILSAGNNLYTFIHNSVNHDYLLLSDVPEMVSVDNKVYCLQYSEFSLEMYFRYLMMNHFIC